MSNVSLHGIPLRAFVYFLRLTAPIFLVVGAVHLVLGVGADVLLGAQLPPEAVLDAALNSQNRFYGAAFSLYGVLFYLCSKNVPKYATVLRGGACALGVHCHSWCAAAASSGAARVGIDSSTTGSLVAWQGQPCGLTLRSSRRATACGLPTRLSSNVGLAPV